MSWKQELWRLIKKTDETRLIIPSNRNETETFADSNPNYLYIVTTNYYTIPKYWNPEKSLYNQQRLDKIFTLKNPKL